MSAAVANSDDDSNLERVALSLLFQTLSESDVRYAVLRNYESLPERVGARDLDIVVEPDDLNLARIIILQVAERLQLLHAHYFADERITQFSLARRVSVSEIFSLKIDLFTDSQVYGIGILSAKSLIRDARLHNGIPVVSSSALLLDKWLFHLFVGQPLHPKYDQVFSEIARDNRLALEKSVATIFTSGLARRIVGELADGQGSRIESLKASTRVFALAKAWVRQGPSATVRSIVFLTRRARDRMLPSGLFLSVSGPDGSGKTTVIDMVMAQLRRLHGDAAVHYRHFRPSVLPRIAEVAQATGITARVDNDYGRPHRANPSGALGSILRLGYYWLDYFAGYYGKVRPALVARQVVLFDRYAYDMVCDPARSRITLPVAFIRAAVSCLPLPRWGFFLCVDDNEVYRRKQELTLKAVKALNARYRDLVGRGILIAVDNGGPPEVAAAAIVDRMVSDKDAGIRRRLSRLTR